MIYFADFETTGKSYFEVNNSTRIYLFYIKGHNFEKIGYSIEEFFKVLETLPTRSVIYFHNLKFDGSFILDYYFNSTIKTKYTLLTLIDIFKSYYSLKFVKPGSPDWNFQFEFRDSLKLFPYKISQLGEILNKPKLITNANYDHFGVNITKNDIEYCKRDVLILSEFFNNFKIFLKKYNVKKIPYSLSSLTRNIFKSTFCQNFDSLFTDKKISLPRSAYLGGFCYLNEKYKGVKLDNVFSSDINSSYPAIMFFEELPYGDDLIKSTITKDDIRNYFIFISFTLKDFKATSHPFIFTKGFIKNEYLLKGDEITLTTSLQEHDFILKNYTYKKYKVLKYYLYKKGNFCQNFVNEFYTKKQSEKLNKHFYKIILNSFYGKFGENPVKTSFSPVGTDPLTGEFIWKENEKETSHNGYLPFAAAITSLARLKLYKIIKKLGDDFIYSDTDSIYFLKEENKKYFKFSLKIGDWKLENESVSFKGLGQKQYICNNVSKVAGLKNTDFLTYDNFISGNVFDSVNLKAKKVKGGVVLLESPFKL